jgi:succinate dehydrogenase / fumarate reductase membrane anchor subunit
MKKQQSIQSPLARARGLGSAHDGVHHWIVQRVTAMAAIPLTLWLVWSVVQMHGWDYEAFLAWQSQPVNAVLMILSVITMFYHAALGLQVIIEDYVQGELPKFLSIHGLNVLFFAGAIACIFSVLKIAFEG